ncbi:hypothetical protein [Bradyrhizobium sp. DOA1]|uniref:hypothetical protein n=1 Tax=Bradyrhizobium sp. DOA1 TaxID=1126616 RepID=UPI0012E98F11|nr:hypothetical protein [Bradyrhizobium sp. DOA1]
MSHIQNSDRVNFVDGATLLHGDLLDHSVSASAGLNARRASHSRHRLQPATIHPTLSNTVKGFGPRIHVKILTYMDLRETLDLNIGSKTSGGRK